MKQQLLENLIDQDNSTTKEEKDIAKQKLMMRLIKLKEMLINQ